MRLVCFKCFQWVTNELPDDTVMRAIAICSECIDAYNKSVKREERERIAKLIEDALEKHTFTGSELFKIRLILAVNSDN